MILSIGKFSYKLIFPFLYAICTFLKTLTYSKGELKNPYVTLLFFSLAQLSMGILEIITQLILKNVRKKKEETEKINLNSLAAEETNSTISSIHNEKEIESRNVRGIVRKIKDYITFLKNNENYETVIQDIGDGIAVSKRKER